MSTTAFMMWSAYGMPISSNAATYGEAPSSLSFHGTMQTSRNIEPTKKVATRKMTELVALAIARSGSLDSAAAMVAISAPTIENTTTTMLEKIAPTPFGQEPAVVGQVAEVEAPCPATGRRRRACRGRGRR